MIHPYPFFGGYNFRRHYYSYPKPPTNINKNFVSDNKKSYSPKITENIKQENFNFSSNFIEDTNCDTNNIENNSEECFEIFGLKLYFDDLLIIALLFFLYQEEVKDTYLYIALILLLLS